MNFLEQRKELAAQLGVDQATPATDTLLKRWLNISQRIILGADNWPYLRGSNPLIIQTVEDYSTGTATVSAGGSTVTLSSAPSTSKTGFYIQFESSNDWFRISAHTAASTSLTIDPVAISANTAASFTIRKFFYSTSSNVDRILQITQKATPYKLREMTKEVFDSIQPTIDQTGIPRMYMMMGKDSSDLWQFILWPSPSSTINIYIDYLQMISDLSTDAETSIIPSKWHADVMLEGAKWKGWEFLDDTRSAEGKAAFYEGIGRMKQELMPSKSLVRKFIAVDQLPLYNEFPYPANYPNV